MQKRLQKVTMLFALVCVANAAYASRALAQDEIIASCSGSCKQLSDCSGLASSTGSCACFANPFGPTCIENQG